MQIVADMTPYGKQRQRRIKRTDLVGTDWEHGTVLSEFCIGYWNVKCKHCEVIHQYETRSILRKSHTKKCDAYRPHNNKYDSFKEGYIERTYGLPYEEYLKMLEEQNHVCAICHKPDEKKALSIDHCHTTGKVRGLLCNGCNRALGFFNDNIDKLFNAAKYLQYANAR